MKKIKIAMSPLTGTIFAGTILKDGMWAAGKQDVTVDALVAVAQYCERFGQPVEITCDGKIEYRITVEAMK